MPPVAVFRWIILLSGAALFAWLIAGVGIGQLGSDLGAIGWWILPYLALTGIENFFHTLSSRLCFSREHRSAFPIWRLYVTYLGGSALNWVTPTAEIGGEVARAAVFEKNVPGSEAASAVIINKFTYSIARMIIAAALTGLTVILFPLGSLDFWLIALGSALTTAALLAFAALQAKGLFGPALLRLAWLAGPKAREWVRTNVGELDRRLRDYYLLHRSDLFLAIALNLAGFSIGVLQKWYLMVLLMPDTTQITIASAASVWGIATLLDMIFFWVTAGIGVQEGSHALAFRAMGLSGDKGISLSVATRIDQVFWIAVGLVCYAAETIGRRKRAHETIDPERR